jgi:hypothetical protein
LSLPSLLQQHHRRRWRRIDGVFFLSNIEKTKHVRKQQKKTREGRELPFKLPLCPLAFGSLFCPLASSALSWLPLLPSRYWLLVLPSCFKLFWALMMEWVQNGVW